MNDQYRSPPGLIGCLPSKAIINVAQRRLVMLVVLVLLCFSMVSQSFAVDPVVLVKDNAPFNLVHHAEYLIEPRNGPFQYHDRLDLAELISHYQNGDFKTVASAQIGFGAQWSVVHIRIPITNITSKEQTWVLAFNRWAGLFNAVSLVLDNPSLPRQTIAQTLDLKDWKDSDVMYHTPFTLPANSTGALFVSYSNGSSAAPMTIETIEGYKGRRLREDIHFFFILALTLGIGLLITLQMAALGQTAANYYLAYLGFSLLWLINNTEYLYRPFLLSALPWINSVDVLLWGVMLSLLFLFQRAFLGDGGHFQRWRWFLLLCAALSIISPLLTLSFGLRYHESIVLSGLLLQIIPPISGVLAVRQRLHGAWPFAIASLAVSLCAVLYMAAFTLSHSIPINNGHYFMAYAFLFEAVVFALAMFRQTRALQQEKHRATQAKLLATRDKLLLHEQLLSTAHDIQQPLTALKLASRLPTLSGSPDSDLLDTVDYLEQLVRKNLATPLAQTENHIRSESTDYDKRVITTDAHNKTEPAELFPVNAVLQNIAAMFAEEAHQRNLNLRVVASDQKVYTSPLVLMRILADIVSIIIENTQSNKILLGCRRRGKFTRIDILENHCVLTSQVPTPPEVPNQRRRVQYSDTSDLSKVEEFCKRHGIKFDPVSENRFSIWVPRLEAD